MPSKSHFHTLLELFGNDPCPCFSPIPFCEIHCCVVINWDTPSWRSLLSNQLENGPNIIINWREAPLLLRPRRSKGLWFQESNEYLIVYLRLPNRITPDPGCISWNPNSLERPLEPSLFILGTCRNLLNEHNETECVCLAVFLFVGGGGNGTDLLGGFSCRCRKRWGNYEPGTRKRTKLLYLHVLKQQQQWTGRLWNVSEWNRMEFVKNPIPKSIGSQSGDRWSTTNQPTVIRWAQEQRRGISEDIEEIWKTRSINNGRGRSGRKE